MRDGEVGERANVQVEGAADGLELTVGDDDLGGVDEVDGGNGGAGAHADPRGGLDVVEALGELTADRDIFEGRGDGVASEVELAVAADVANVDGGA